MNTSLFGVVHLSTGRQLRGGERQVLLLHQGLLQRGIRSLLVCSTRSALAALHHDSVVASAPVRPWDMAGLVRLGRLLRSDRPVVLHCHDAHALLYGALVARGRTAVLVATRRTLFHPDKGALSRWKYSRCAALIGISGAVVHQCAGLVGQERAVLIHSAVPWGSGDLGREEARRRLDLAPDELAAGSVGHFTAEKNLPVLVAAGQRLALACPRLRLVCIGPHNLPHHSARAPAAVRLVGPVADAGRYYAAFDLYVSASRMEGLGTALVDAVVRDLPAVATDAGGTRDIFPEGWQLVPPGDVAGLAEALRWTVEHPTEAAARAKVAGARARQLFSVDTMVAQTLALYDRVIAGVPGAGTA